MILILFRHGIAVEASEFAGQDFDRPLTPKGRKRTSAAAAGLISLIDYPDVVVSSPRVRARETAGLLLEQLNSKLTLTNWSELSTGANQRVQELLSRLHGKKTETVILVGHEPHLSQLASLLLTGSETTLSLNLKKAGAIAIEWTPDSSTLLWHLGPSHLIALTEK